MAFVVFQSYSPIVAFLWRPAMFVCMAAMQKCIARLFPFRSRFVPPDAALAKL
jgi:hypothetical protein